MTDSSPAATHDSGDSPRPTLFAVVCALGMTALSFLVRAGSGGREPRWLGWLLPRSHSAGLDGAPSKVSLVKQAPTPPRSGGLTRLVGRTPRERIGTLITVAGALTLLYAVGTFLELTPGSHVVIPDPPALSRERPTFAEAADDAGALPVATEATVADGGAAENGAADDPALSEAPEEVAGGLTEARRRRATAARPAFALGVPDADELVRAERVTDRLVFEEPIKPLKLKRMPRNADNLDRQVEAGFTRPGIPVGLSIERIGIETEVIKAGLQEDGEGNVIWETVPYVAAYYTPTSLVGARGNAVIAGHVVTLYEGNVFANLYQVDFGDRIVVTTAEGTFTYEVRDIKLVKPEDVHVMAPTRDATLTLITCGGEFDRWSQSFEKRLVVVGKLIRS